MSVFSKLPSVFLYLVFSLSILAGFAVLFVLTNVLITLDPQGDVTRDCDVYDDLGSVPNGTGLIVTAHDLVCTYGIIHANDARTFVYVHKVGTPDDRNSLVLRYENSDGNYDPPQMVWNDARNLHISAKRVGEVTKEIDFIEGVKISYSIDIEETPRGESFRSEARFAAILATVLIFLAGISVTTARTILRLKNRQVASAQD